MKNPRPVLSPAFRIATIAVLAAATTVFTLLVRVPFPPTRGYFNLGDVAIAFAAYTFGPISALIAGGLGTAIADLIGGFAQWAPISLVVHGLQGLVIGLIARLKPGNLPVAIAAGIGGIAVMVVGYGVGGALMTGIGPAIAEALGNLVQSAAGVILGIPLSLAVARAYPPVRNWTW